MTFKSKLGFCLVTLLVLAGCEQPTPEDIEQMKRDREAVTRAMLNDYMPLLPTIADACAQRVEGKAASFTFLEKVGFEKDRGFGRDFYLGSWQVGDQIAGLAIVMHPKGCFFNLPTNGAIDPTKHRAGLVRGLQKRGYSVSQTKEISNTSSAAQSIITGALFGVSIVSDEVQSATKGGVEIEIKSTYSRNSAGHSWTEYFLEKEPDA